MNEFATDEEAQAAQRARAGQPPEMSKETKDELHKQALVHTLNVERHARGLLQSALAKHLKDVKAKLGNPASRDAALSKAFKAVQDFLHQQYNPQVTQPVTVPEGTKVDVTGSDGVTTTHDLTDVRRTEETPEELQ